MALLLVLAGIVLVTAWQLEREASLVETDSVPGLIQSHALRAAYSDGYLCLLQLPELEGTRDGDVLHEKIQRIDERADEARVAYQKTVRIDPREDLAKLQALLLARDELLEVRRDYFNLLREGRHNDIQRCLRERLNPAYDRLMTACDALITYNNSTGTLFSAGVVHAVVRLRWIVFGILVLALAGAAMVTEAAMRRTRIERELRESERKFASAFKVSPHAMAISRRRDGTLIEVNDALRNFYGLREGEVRGKTSQQIGIWRGVGEREQVIEMLQRDGHVRELVRERLRHDGQKATVLLSMEPLVLSGEECVLSTAQDITQRVEAERALERAVVEYRALFDSAPMSIVLVAPDSRVLRCNQAFATLLGYSVEELSRMTIADFTHPDDVANDRQRFFNLVAGALPSFKVEKRYINRAGELVWGRLTSSVVRGPDGQVVFVVGMIEDISAAKKAAVALQDSEAARQQLQEQLIVAQKLEALGQLAGGVAHDFNNVLAAIMLYLDLVKTEIAVSSTLREPLAELSTAAKRAAGLTRQLLLFSRREPAQRHAIELNALVANLQKMLERLLGAHFELAHSGPSAPLRVQADAGMIEQVVMNLVVNARDAMPRGGRIEVQLSAVELSEMQARQQVGRRAGSFVRLAVADTGCGMSATVRAHIFEPFFTTKEAGKGTGLGLSTVLGIVQQHAGWLEVQSVEGQGSTFEVYLPAHAGAPEAPLPSVAAASAMRGRETILLAEDNDVVRHVSARILRARGYRVLDAADGNLAREILTARLGEIDLLITDVVLPGGLLGHELAASLPEGTQRPKVILMSGYNAHVDQAMLEAIGAYLSKPFDSETLLRTVRDTLDGEVA